MNPFYLNDQLVWFHDEGDDSDYFHTFDALVVDQALDPLRKVHVFLPRQYHSTDRGYPVVYMNDGNTAFWANGLRAPRSSETARDLYKLYL